MMAPELSIVAPVYNEAAVLPELVARCTGAAEQCAVAFEMIVVDDASRDATADVMAVLAAQDERVRSLRLAANRGQFGATQAGLRAARGRFVLVLDGDLQDPPERIPDLWRTIASAPSSVAAVAAVKSGRDDPIPVWFGQLVFHRLQALLSAVPLPHGAGSYCVMRREVAERVAAARLARANLSAIVAVAARAMNAEVGSLAYEKAARYDGSGRVGMRGLVLEALDSLSATGALSRLLAMLAIACAGGALLASHPWARGALLVASSIAVLASLLIAWRVRRTLAAVRAGQS